MFRFSDRDVHIFIVDDDEIQLKVLKNKFVTDLNNYRLKTFITGEDLLDYLSKNPLKRRNAYITVLDYYLKSKQFKDVKDGLDILRILKTQYPSNEVIVLSAYDEDNEAQIHDMVKEIGAVDFIKKNEHSYVRIQNIVMRIVSSKILHWKKIERNVSVLVLFSLTCITSAVLLILSWLQ